MGISQDFVVQLLQFIGGLAVLIFVHELGHFLAARLLGVDVEEFGIGFPPRALRLFSAGGTLFTLNWLPLGGFVRLKGENDPSVPGGFASANPYKRLAVLFAGPFMNIAVGVILSTILFYNFGEPIPDQVQILSISENSPAEDAGLQTGDFLVEVNSRPVESIEDLHDEIYSNLGEDIQLTYQRDGTLNTITLVPRDPPPSDGAVGILMGNPTRPTTWTRAIPNGIRVTYEYTRSLLALPVRMIRGEVSPEEGRPLGYKGMFDVYQQIQDPLWFFMVISMSLGIFNLFPIPALDGGRILFTLPEILLRRRVPPEYENLVHLIGFTVLLILLIYINVQDFINPVILPR